MAASDQPPSDEAIERRLTNALNGPAAPSRFPLPTLGLTAILAIFGVFLIAQSSRWHRTPSYGNLLTLMPADAWGGVYLGVAAIMAIALIWPTRWLALGAHAAALVLLLGWEFAFLIRWLTDSGTTIVNVVSWGVYVAILLRSAQLINSRAATA